MEAAGPGGMRKLGDSDRASQEGAWELSQPPPPHPHPSPPIPTLPGSGAPLALRSALSKGASQPRHIHSPPEPISLERGDL